jgi:hypothetical protein
MTHRLVAVLLALPALVAGLLVISPAEAATTHRTYVTTKYVTMTKISDTGVGGKVSVSCHGSSRCKGTLYFEGSTNRKRSYSLKGNSTASISVTMNSSSPSNPANDTQSRVDHGDYYAVPNVQLFVDESAPRNIAPFHYNVQTETKAPGRIYYDVKNHSNAGLKSMSVQLHRVLKGGNTALAGSRDVFGLADKSGYFTSKLGTNNTPGQPYRLKLTAKGPNNEHYEWWWRGTSGNPDGGSRYLREANTVRATKAGFDVDIYFGTIAGTAPNGTEVKVLAPPHSFSGGTSVRRELDVPNCANIFGEDTADGTYSIPFLPYDNDGADHRYMVSASGGGDRVWLGATDEPYGSCSDVLNYRLSTNTNLIALPGGATRAITTAQLRPSGNEITVRRYYSGFTPQSADKWVRLREKVPGLAVLDSPVVTEGTASTGSGGRNKTFHNVPPGKYWVEQGRRTGCSTWYPSRYTNNKAYFNGADRGAEAWKSFRRLASLPGNASSGLERIAIAHGATYERQNKSSGSAGWMYRGYCKALGAGTYSNELNVTGYDNTVTKATSVNRKGAVVRGHVTRSGGRTNKEMLVTLSSTDGKRVLRTDFTDGAGNFYVAGLPSGNWKITVNADSWRGIARTFTGKHSIRVSRGHNYNAGTLRFKG